MECPLAISTKPKIGFFGAIASWLDLKPLLVLMDKNYLVEMVGPVSHVEFPVLTQHKNFKYFGILPHKDLAIIASTWKCGMIPFVESPLTQCVDPVKLYEYSILGLPIVATDLKEIHYVADTMPILAKPYLVPAKHPITFYHNVKQAIEEDNDEKRKSRIAWAKTQTWKMRVDAVLSALDLEKWIPYDT